MTVFNGTVFASSREMVLQQQVRALASKGVRLTIAAILFSEDAGSVLYTRLKSEAAQRVGIEYQRYQFSAEDHLQKVLETVAQLNADPTVTGIIIQKPWRKSLKKERAEYQQWWHTLVSAIDKKKDVDGLHPDTLAAIEAGNWREQGAVLPATAQAVLNIVRHRFEEESGVVSSNLYAIPPGFKVVVIGRSEIVGKPLWYELKNQNIETELIGKKQLSDRIATGLNLHDADVVISATGQAGLITGSLLKPQVTLIDVGEPKPDVDRASVGDLPSFITPVPNGVGPVTVVGLLENCLALSSTFPEIV